MKGVHVQITDVSRLKIQLPIGGAMEQIAVSAKLPLIQTENATLGRVIDHETVVDLPLVDRNFTEILGLTAGTNTDILDATQLGAGSQEIRANGARNGDNNFMRSLCLAADSGPLFSLLACFDVWQNWDGYNGWIAVLV